MNRLIEHVVVAALALFLIGPAFFMASPASAHASLLSTDPPEGSVLQESPPSLVLTFNEQVSVGALRLYDDVGAETDLADFHVDGNALVVDVPPIGIGTHVLNWRVLSADSHPIGGSLSFSVGQPSATFAAPAAEPDSRIGFVVWAGGLLFLGGLLFGVGGVFFICCIAPKADPRPAAFDTGLALIAGMAGGVISLGAQGVDMLGVPLGAMTELGTWRAALLSSYGPGWLAGEATLAVAAVALLFRGQRAAAGLSTVALIGVGVTLSVSGHANDTALLSLNRTAVFFHGMGAAAWAGALVPLAALFIRRDPSAGIALKRFSAAIPFFVIPLVAAGVFLAASQLTSWDDLWTTAYGSILSAKLVAVAVLLALAAFNRYRLTWPAVAGSKKATSALVLLTRVEWALVVVILALVAEWRLTPPPTALLAAAASLPVPGYVVMASADGTIFADVGFTPGRVGPNDVVIEVTDNEGEPINVSEVSLALSLPSAEITSTTRTAVLSRDNVWKIPGLVLPAAGTWKITLDVLKSDFADTKIDAEVAITR